MSVEVQLIVVAAIVFVGFVFQLFLYAALSGHVERLDNEVQGLREYTYSRQPESNSQHLTMFDD